MNDQHHYCAAPLADGSTCLAPATHLYVQWGHRTLHTCDAHLAEPIRRCTACGVETSKLYGGMGRFFAVCADCWNQSLGTGREGPWASDNAHVAYRQDGSPFPVLHSTFCPCFRQKDARWTECIPTCVAWKHQ